MPRSTRIYPDGVPQHIYNRGNRRARIFQERADYLGFLAALAIAAERTTVRLLAFCVMPNHFHLLLWPDVGVQISSYMQLVMNIHIRDVQIRHQMRGTGHVYQGRHKNVPILTEHHLLVAARYVEGNALAAALVPRAQEWEWCSLNQAEHCSVLLAPWPVNRPSDWNDLVNEIPSDKSIKEIRKYARTAYKLGAFSMPRDAESRS
jgi:putative transposase